MYSKSFSTAEKKRDSSVPVEYFSDSFSADAFKKSAGSQIEKNEPHSKQDTPQKTFRDNSDDENKKEIAPTKSVRNYNFEDLILLGLVLLFLNDINDKEDLIIPIILGVILLS